MTVDVWMLIVTAAAPLLALGVPGLVTWGRMRGEISALERRAEKFDALTERVARVETGATADTKLLERHFEADMAGMHAIEEQIRSLRAEMMDVMAELRADVRAMIGREDTNPRSR